MVSVHFLHVLLGLVSAFSPLAHAGNVQLPGLTLPSDAAANRQAVKDAFVSAYGDYKKYAFGHDDLAPLSKSYVDSRNGWGATIVDSMSTMLVMGLNDLYAEALNFTSKIDFSKSHTTAVVSLFETTIRFLGGMLSAYELNGNKDSVLIKQSKALGDKLSVGWVGDVPYNDLNFASNSPVLGGSTSIAGAGTLTLEFYTLSKYANDKKYQLLAEKTIRRIASNPAPLPGLPPQTVDPASGNSVGDYISWGGGSDSYFEYLLKYGRLTNNADPLWVSEWLTAVDSSIRYLTTTSTVGGHLYLTDFTGGKKRYIGSHLECFHGGNWIMGGKLVNNQTIVDYGLKLTDACFNTYSSTATGIGPEVFAYLGTDGNSTSGPAPTATDLAFYNQHGFYVYDGNDYYDLRPEVLESNFYAWRATGDIKYQQRAAAALQSILKNCKAPLAFAPISDVRVLNSGFIDDTESFFFAEVMKYLYLTFDDPSHISLDEWVFNTEAHPFKAPAAIASYRPASATKPKSEPFTLSTSNDVPAISPNPRLPKQLSDVVAAASDA